MTRYTKLDKRKAPQKATDYFNDASLPEDDEPAQAAPSSSSSAAAAAVSQGAATGSPDSSKKKRKVSAQQDADTDAAQSAGITAAESVETEPKRLQARLKLLRLKLKNAKGSEKQERLKGEIKGVHEAIKVANGNAGKAAGPSDGKPARRAKPQVEESTETNPWKKMEAERRAKSSAKNDVRREKRSAERASQTRCFACRSMGHAAKDCPQTLNANSTALESEEGSGAANGMDANGTATDPTVSSSKASVLGSEAVGICFRCGSTEHILSRCRRPAPRVGSDLPFATCFVCGAKGHLSSKCPRNAGRGVYPNGGCCKLCQSVEHLAKDCPLRQASATEATNAAIGSRGRGHMQPRGYSSRDQSGRGGADDDDFHDFARKRAEIDQEVKREQKMQQQQQRVPGDGPPANHARPAKSKVVSF